MLLNKKKINNEFSNKLTNNLFSNKLRNNEFVEEENFLLFSRDLEREIVENCAKFNTVEGQRRYWTLCRDIEKELNDKFGDILNLNKATFKFQHYNDIIWFLALKGYKVVVFSGDNNETKFHVGATHRVEKGITKVIN